MLKMGGGLAVALSRYHLSPHSPDVVGVCVLADQRIQAPRDFNRDAPRPRRVSENYHGLSKASDRLCRIGISGIDALGQSFLKLDELFLITAGSPCPFAIASTSRSISRFSSPSRNSR
jgi:hypothetical protein